MFTLYVSKKTSLSKHVIHLWSNHLSICHDISRSMCEEGRIEYSAYRCIRATNVMDITRRRPSWWIIGSYQQLINTNYMDVPEFNSIPVACNNQIPYEHLNRHEPCKPNKLNKSAHKICCWERRWLTRISGKLMWLCSDLFSVSKSEKRLDIFKLNFCLFHFWWEMTQLSGFNSKLL